VLDLRRRLFEATQAALARAHQERDGAAAGVREAEEAVEHAEQASRQALEQGGEAGAAERHRIWIVRQRAWTEACRRALAERQTAVDCVAADVRRAHREVRVLERLRDRAWVEYQDESRRLEAIEMDQLAVVRHAQKMREGGLTE